MSDDRLQCDSCLAYKDISEFSLDNVCDDCVDKAASYDRAFNDKNYLIKAIENAINIADNVKEKATIIECVYNIGQIKGVLKAALDYVRS